MPAYKYMATQHALDEEFEEPKVESGNEWELFKANPTYYTERAMVQSKDFVIVVAIWRKKI